MDASFLSFATIQSLKDITNLYPLGDPGSTKTKTPLSLTRDHKASISISLYLAVGTSYNTNPTTTISNFPFSPPIPGIIERESTQRILFPHFSFSSPVRYLPSFLMLVLGSTAAILFKLSEKMVCPAQRPEPSPDPKSRSDSGLKVDGILFLTSLRIRL